MDNGGLDSVVEGRFLLGGLLQDLVGEEERLRPHDSGKHRLASEPPHLGATSGTLDRLGGRVSKAPESTQRGEKASHAHEERRNSLTQPVAANIRRSRGSPERRPSRVVSEWQAAMAATNGELARRGSRTSRPIGRKLERKRTAADPSPDRGRALPASPGPGRTKGCFLGEQGRNIQ